MTALMPDRTRPSAGELRRDLRHRRPLVLLAPVAGAVAAASTLVVCLALGVAGWFLTDAGTHGTPRDGLWVGALAWLMAHGSGVHVGGALVSVMPLGITLACAWVDLADRAPARRLDLRPRPGRPADRRRRAGLDGPDGGAALRRRLRRGRGPSPRRWPRPPRPRPTPRGSCCGRCCSAAVLGAPAIAIGSGRAAIWTATLPASVVGHGRRLPPGAHDLAAGLPGRLPGRAGHRLRHRAQRHLAARTPTPAPPCSWSSSRCWWSRTRWSSRAPTCSAPASPSGTHTHRLAGRGHRRRAADVPAAGRPARHRADARPGPPALVGVPPARGGGRRDARPARAPDVPLGGGRPARLRRRHAGRRRCSACSPLLAGGAVGPGRMTDVGPLAGAVLVHAVTAFGIGGLLGGLVATWWQRRSLEPLPEAAASPSRDAQVVARHDADALDEIRTQPRPICPGPRRGRGALDSPIRADPLVRGRARAPRRPRLGVRHQPPGAARRGRGPGVRRHGGRGRRRPRRHRGAGAGRAGRACRRSCTGSRTSPTAPPGTARSPPRSPSTARPGRLGRLHEAGRHRRSWPRSAAGSSTPTRR